MSEVLIPVLITTALLAANGVFVAAEFAILAAPRTHIARLALRGVRTAQWVQRIQQDQRRLDRYVATAQLGITFASLGLGMYAEHVFAGLLEPLLMAAGVQSGVALHSISGVLAVLLLTYLHVVLGEMIPKSLALLHGDQAVLWVSWPMLWFHRLFLPLVLLLNGTANVLLRLARVPSQNQAARLHTPEEIEMIVEESQKRGALGEEESEILRNLFHFSDMQVRKVMVPRIRVVGVPLDMPVEQVLRLVVENRHTRYPVYVGSMDQIRGILHVKELFRELRRNPDNPRLRRAMRRPVFVPEQMTVEDLLVEFRNHRSQIAVVMDEYGGTAGIVSLEDVLEEIFGEVQDEFDQEEPAIQMVSERQAIMSGVVRLDEFAEEFGIHLEREDVDTIGGLIMAELGRPPRIGDTVAIEDIRFVVRGLNGLAVGKLEVTFPEGPPPMRDGDDEVPE